ncbi:MAG: multifunctional CCA addition/repair protein [Gammaproteobacteria bacterium]|nr:multifunctional CCA addition/repair protein [Gammaproteobacteria bacterium]
MKIYQVGGSVRDQLLGLPIQDRDWVVVGATPADMEARGFKMVGADFPVFLHPETREEYALARTERKSAPGYKGFTVHAAPDVTLEDDLKRRDLTINAMALDENGVLIDPFHGAQDLKNKLLRHVSPAFAEDPVRILRTARFAARFPDFRVADETRVLMRHMTDNGEVDALVPERVWAELERALGENRPARFFETLRGCGALEKLFPELARLYGVPQPENYHPEIDTGVHTMLVLDQATRISPDPRVRFAALLHDLGKGTTPKEEWPHHIGHEERSVDLVQAICARFKAPNDYRDLAILAAKYHGDCHRAAELRPATLLKILEAVDAARRPERFDLFLLACEADARGRPGYEDKPYPQSGIFRAALRAYNSVEAQPLAATGLKGEAIAQELRRLRIQAISAIRPQPDASLP